MKNLSFILIQLLILSFVSCSRNGGKVEIVVPSHPSDQLLYAKEKLEQALDQNIVPRGSWIIELQERTQLPKEGYTITRSDDRITISGNDGSGVIYGVDEFIESSLQSEGEGCWTMTRAIVDSPALNLRGCNFDFKERNNLPEWFYDEAQWIGYLDMMAENRLNTLFLPTSLMNVDSTTLSINKEMLEYLASEAGRRGILLAKMDHNALIGVHGDNDTIYAVSQCMPYLNPWRWTSSTRIWKEVSELQKSGAGVLNLCALSSNSDYPYTADKLADGGRQLQIERDWMWYRAWGRYAWRKSASFDAESEAQYWSQQLAHHYGTTAENAALMLLALDQSGNIAPDLQQYFGILEDDRQSFLLGMLCTQMINPSKYTFGSELNPQVGELPLDIAEASVQYALKAVEAVDAVSVRKIAKNKRSEFLRLCNDMYCYRDFAYAFMYKVQACRKVLDYKSDHDLAHLEEAASLLNKSLGWWRGLVMYTHNSYCYASMTPSLRIPVAISEDETKHWDDLLSVYDDEMECLKANIETLKAKYTPADSIAQDSIIIARPFGVKLVGRYLRGYLRKGYSVVPDKPAFYVDAIAEEIQNLTTFIYDDVKSMQDSHVIEFVTDYPVNLMVGFYRSKESKYARVPQWNDEIEQDSTFYGCQLVLQSAIRIKGMPLADVYRYHFEPGYHKLTLPKGISLVCGFTYDMIKPRNVGLEGNSDMEWLFN